MASISTDEPLGVSDLVSLEDLNQTTLLKNLKIRFSQNIIYTYIGSILISGKPQKKNSNKSKY